MNIIGGLFTSEAVSAGHPDKLCDRISDSILDAFLALDPNSRVACEALAADDKIVVAGEFSAAEGVFEAVRAQAEAIVRRAIAEVGYGSSELDIDPADCAVEIRFNHQSPEIRQGVDGGERLGAGDQGSHVVRPSAEDDESFVVRPDFGDVSTEVASLVSSAITRIMNDRLQATSASALDSGSEALGIAEELVEDTSSINTSSDGRETNDAPIVGDPVNAM